MNRDQLQRQLILHEGLKLESYKDTVGKWTIGVGRNLQDNPLTNAERIYLGLHPETKYQDIELTRKQAMYLLDNDIDKCLGQCVKSFRWFPDLSNVRQHVILDMCFNLGIQGLLEFHNTLRFIRDKKYQAAAGNMLISKWAEQVGQRSRNLANMMYNDLYPEEMLRHMNAR